MTSKILLEEYYEECGPTHTGAVATSDPTYTKLLFSNMQTAAVSTSVAFVDMAKFADGNVHRDWLGQGVYVKLALPGKAYIRQRSETSTGVSTSLMRTVDPTKLANGELDLVFDRDLRWLEIVADAGGTLQYWRACRIPVLAKSSDADI